jgi:hypothetical protein
MQIKNEEIEELKRLEESLWIAKTRFDQEYMNVILSRGFFEFGRSGRIYNREESLKASYQDINAVLPLKDFVIHALSSDVVLITYISEVAYETLEVANRSSIWIRTPTGWQLEFHQGTPVLNDQ